jgi:hypothetical protein
MEQWSDGGAKRWPRKLSGLARIQPRLSEARPRERSPNGAALKAGQTQTMGATSNCEL